MAPPCSPVASRTISIAPSYIPRVPVNWPVRQVHQIARPYLPRAIINTLTNIKPLTVNWSVRHVPQIASPGLTGTPPPGRRSLTQSSKGPQQGQLVNPSSIPCGLGCPDMLYIANQFPCTTI